MHSSSNNTDQDTKKETMHTCSPHTAAGQQDLHWMSARVSSRSKPGAYDVEIPKEHCPLQALTALSNIPEEFSSSGGSCI